MLESSDMYRDSIQKADMDWLLCFALNLWVDE
jgi:hypothetical protein